jgi:hypothetical protein
MTPEQRYRVGQALGKMGGQITENAYSNNHGALKQPRVKRIVGFYKSEVVTSSSVKVCFYKVVNSVRIIEIDNPGLCPRVARFD